MATTMTARRLSPAFFSRSLPLRIRTMSTAAAQTHQFLVIIPDKPGVKDLRMQVRAQHLAELKPRIESRAMRFGGALLNEPAPSADSSTWDFCGSTVIVEANSKEEVLEQLNADIYTKSGVWDAEKAQIFPFKVAFGMK